MNAGSPSGSSSKRDTIFWMVLTGVILCVLGVLLPLYAVIQIIGSITTLRGDLLNHAIVALIGIGMYIIGSVVIRAAAGYKKRTASSAFIMDALLGRLDGNIPPTSNNP